MSIYSQFEDLKISLRNELNSIMSKGTIDSLLGLFDINKDTSNIVNVIVIMSDYETDITAGVKDSFTADFNGTIQELPYFELSTAGSGTDKVTVDILKNNVSIFSTLMTADSTEKTSKTASVSAVMSTSNVMEGDVFSFQITKVGGTDAGKGCKVHMKILKS